MSYDADDRTVRVPKGQLGPVTAYQDRGPGHGDGMCRVDWDDGSSWFLSIQRDCGGIAVERWYEPDELEDEDFGPWRDCPGPDYGVFASIDGVEVAMGAELPNAVYNDLYADEVYGQVSDWNRAAWGESVAFEIVHLLDDGVLVETWAPPWADDPLDPDWDIDFL